MLNRKHIVHQALVVGMMISVPTFAMAQDGHDTEQFKIGLEPKPKTQEDYVPDSIHEGPQFDPSKIGDRYKAEPRHFSLTCHESQHPLRLENTNRIERYQDVSVHSGKYIGGGRAIEVAGLAYQVDGTVYLPVREAFAPKDVVTTQQITTPCLKIRIHDIHPSEYDHIELEWRKPRQAESSENSDQKKGGEEEQ